jgi:antitoxin ChpS
MYTTNLRKVGGSVMLTVPPAFLDQLHLQLAVEGERLVVQTRPKPRYTLEELLAKCGPASADEEMSEEDRIWINLPPVGREL